MGYRIVGGTGPEESLTEKETCRSPSLFAWLSPAERRPDMAKVAGSNPAANI